MKPNHDQEDIDSIDHQCKQLLQKEFSSSEDDDEFYIPDSWTSNRAPIQPITDFGPKLPLVVQSHQQKDESITEEQVRQQAYLIWLQTKRDDSVANWHDAADQLQKKRKPIQK